MTLVPDKGWLLEQSEGWVKVSEGALQYERRTLSGSLGITHSATPPTIGAADSFIEINKGIRTSFGSEPCYVHAIGEDVYVEFLDIS